MEAIKEGWHGCNELDSSNFVEKIANCRRAFSKWRHNLTPFGRDVIADLKINWRF